MSTPFEAPRLHLADRVALPEARRWRGLTAVLLFVLALLALYFVPLEYAYEPPARRVLNESPAHPHPAYDQWGTDWSRPEAERLLSTPSGRAALSPAAGAVQVDDRLLALGRASFYAETFGNEVFLSQVLGIIDGPVGLAQYAKAIALLKGGATTNLRVEIARDAEIGGRTFRRGQLIDTGLDVARGTVAPLGMAVRRQRGRFQVGITCAACHSTVDPRTGLVVHGAPNADLNSGLLLALAPNSAAFFPHVGLKSLDAFMTERSPTMTAPGGRRVRLPDPDQLEHAVDAQLLKWPPGSFDSMVDLVAAPTQIPDSFTFEDYPYNWSGAFMAGPFRGLSVQSNNVHALNSDPFVHADASARLFGIEKELYLATLLQHAARARYRFDSSTGVVPSAFFASVDPTPGTPGMNEVVRVPTYPQVSLIAPDGLWNTAPGERVWERVNAMSAWQNTLVPPRPPIPRSLERFERGRSVFGRAGCPRCHSGPGFMNHRIVPVEEIGTEPARAHALHDTEKIFTQPVALGFDQKAPLSAQPRSINVPTAELDPQQIQLAFAHGDSLGGYKTPGLSGLFWSAPYLHDGGVAVGADEKTELGAAGTVLRFVAPDPSHSLRALLDRELRARVIEANDASADLQQVHVRGVGHEFWVDSSAGFDSEDQRSLIHYLLLIDDG
jgi:hypothetical protein